MTFGRWRWRLVRICGESMAPRLRPGSFALFRPPRHLTSGDTVLVEHPRYGRIVKSVRAIADGEVWLEGLSSHSIAADRLGSVPFQAILGRLAFQVSPPG